MLSGGRTTHGRCGIGSEPWQDLALHRVSWDAPVLLSTRAREAISVPGYDAFKCSLYRAIVGNSFGNCCGHRASFAHRAGDRGTPSENYTMGLRSPAPSRELCDEKP